LCRVYALRALLNALAPGPLIGAEEEPELGGIPGNLKAVSAGWAEGANSDKLASWTKKGLELATELDRTTQETTAVEYGYLMRKRLGLRRQDSTNESNLFIPLLGLMESSQLLLFVLSQVSDLLYLHYLKNQLPTRPIPKKAQNQPCYTNLSPILIISYVDVSTNVS